MKTNECARDIVINLLTEQFKINNDLYKAILPYLDSEEIAVKIMKHCVAVSFILENDNSQYNKEVIYMIEEAVALLLADPKAQLIEFDVN